MDNTTIPINPLLGWFDYSLEMFLTYYVLLGLNGLILNAIMIYSYMSSDQLKENRWNYFN